jgi:hypothetical protein
MKTRNLILPSLIAFSFLFIAAGPYPIDGYDISGIRRLKRLQLVVDGTI